MSTDKGVDKEDVVLTYSGILLSHKKNKIMPFATTLINPEIIILSKVKSDHKKINIIPFICGI